MVQAHRCTWCNHCQCRSIIEFLHYWCHLCYEYTDATLFWAPMAQELDLYHIHSSLPLVSHSSNLPSNSILLRNNHQSSFLNQTTDLYRFCFCYSWIDSQWCLDIYLVATHISNASPLKDWYMLLRQSDLRTSL